MARRGQVVEGPFTQVTFLETAADTNGERLVMEHRIQPGNTPPPDHLHRQQEETFEVLAGRMWVRVLGEARTLSVGEGVTVPKGTPHTFKNAGDGALQVRVTLGPALNSEAFFETIVGLERRDLLPGARITWPQLLQMALLVTHYDMPLAGPPLWLQRPVFRLLSALARLSGFRAWYRTVYTGRSRVSMRGARMRVLRVGVYLFALVGAAFVVYLGVALALDARNLDRTRGGYEPPYTGYTGEPLRFDEVAVTAEGGVVRGWVLDSLVNCTTGRWSFEALGLSFDYRVVSERALVVHKPQEICRQHGFDTSAWDSGY